MQQEQLERLKTWFTKYVSGFYTAGDDFLNSNIKLKECHTHRVCKETRELTAAMKMDAADCRIAEAIALLHDVGRFPQFKKYRTYKDTVSENHCLLALTVMDEHDVLNELDPDERAVIEQAIRWHGERELPELDELTLYFAKIIRDADKIDIFELLVENYRLLAYEPDRFTWELEFPDEPECSAEILEALESGQLIYYSQIKTVNDAKLLQIGWVYDVYFDYCLKQIYDRGYLQAIIDLLPKNKEVTQAVNCVLSYVKNRIQSSRGSA